MVEDLHNACRDELAALEEKEFSKDHSGFTSQDNLPSGWYSAGGKKPTVSDPYGCTWESPDHQAIRSRYAGKIFQRRISSIPKIVGAIGGLLGIAAFFMRCTTG